MSGGWTHQEVLLLSPICTFCARIRGFPRQHSAAFPDGIQQCAAFPNGIPDEIWEGRNDHRQPYPGDNGLIFELAPEANAEAAEEARRMEPALES